MTKDYMKRNTYLDYTAFDIHYAAFKRGQERKLKKMIRRKVRRNDKMIVKKILTN